MPPSLRPLALLLGFLSLLLVVAANEATGGDMCRRNPFASLEVASQLLLHGSISECPSQAVQLRCNGRATLDNEDYLDYVGSADCTVCNPVSGCQRFDVLRGQSSTSQTISFADGENIIQLQAHTSPNIQPFTADIVTCRRDNQYCVAKCASCTQTITARCFKNDTVGLAAALANSTTNGIGSNDNTVATGLVNPNEPIGASDFSASLPVQDGQRLNPACVLSQLTFRSPYRWDFSSEKYVVPLQQNCSAATIIDDCSSLTHRQVALLSTGLSDTSETAMHTYLLVDAPQRCAGVRDNAAYNRPHDWDTAVTSYEFGGDFLFVTNRDISNAPVCSDSRIGDNGPAVALPPLPALLRSTFTATTRHSTVNSLCDDGSCVGGNEDGRCSSCSYTYQVRFHCPLDYFDCAAPPNSTHNPCAPSQICTNDATIYTRPTCADIVSSSSSTGVDAGDIGSSSSGAGSSGISTGVEARGSSSPGISSSSGGSTTPGSSSAGSSGSVSVSASTGGGTVESFNSSTAEQTLAEEEGAAEWSTPFSGMLHALCMLVAFGAAKQY